MKITRLQNKVKMLLEYSTKLGINYTTILPEECLFKVFLKDGRFFSNDDVNYITICAKEEKEKRWDGKE
jgi:hypothetical protein